MHPLRFGVVSLLVVAVVAGLAFRVIEMAAGVPSAAAATDAEAPVPAFTLAQLPPGFDHPPTVTIERNVGAGWSDLDRPGWTYAGSSARAIIEASKAKKLRSVVLRGVAGAVYRIDPHAFARLLPSSRMRQFPTWVAHAYMFVASNRHAAVAYALGGVDLQTFLDSTDSPPPAAADDPSAQVLVASDGVEQRGSDRLVRGLRISGQSGCGTDCYRQSWTQLLERTYTDRIRVAYRSGSGGHRRVVSVTGFAAPCATEPAPPAAPSGSFGVSSLGGPAIETRPIAVNGATVDVHTITPTAIPDAPLGSGAPEVTRRSPRNGRAQVFLCVPEPGGASVDIWSDDSKLTDAELVRIAAGVRAAQGNARRRLLATAGATDDLARGRATKGITAEFSPAPVRTVTRPPLTIPDPLPPAKPGTVIAQRKVRGTGASGVTVYRVLYHSRDRNGRDIATTATIVVPDGAGKKRPVVVNGHGTQSMVDGCGRTIDEPTDIGRYQGIYPTLIKAGVIIVMPDYIGNGGTRGVHTYLDVAELAHAMLDGARAARQLGGTGPVGFTGFSEGASASLAAGGYAAQYAPELDVRAVAASSTTTLYAEAFATAKSVPIAGAYASHILVGLLAAHPELDPHEVLTTQGLETLAAIRRYELSEVCPSNIPQLRPRDFAVDPGTLPRWRTAIEANYPDRLRIGAPVLLTHYDTEVLHPVQLAETVCRSLVASGTDIRFWHYANQTDNQNHDTFDRDRWILDRLRSTSPPAEPAWHGDPPVIGQPC